MKKELMVLFVATFLVGLLLVSGCVDETEDIINEYSKHTDTFKEDISNMNGIVLKWDTIMEGTIDIEDVERLAQIATDYKNEYNIVTNHLTSFKEFIQANENILKEAGVDTFEDKKTLDDNEATLQNNINGMVDDIESYIIYFESQQQEIEELNAILDILGALI